MVDPIMDMSVRAMSIEQLMSKEWLVTNGFGGYASGTVAGINTRRHHGLLVANLPFPYGRMMLMPALREEILIGDEHVELGGREFNDGTINAHGQPYLVGFRLEWQTPVWTYNLKGNVLEKKIFMPYGDNTVYAAYTVRHGTGIKMRLRPYCACRRHDSQLGYPHRWPFNVKEVGGGFYEVSAFEGAPITRMSLDLRPGVFQTSKDCIQNVFYHIEAARGLDAVEDMVSPGFFDIELPPGQTVFFIASTEPREELIRPPEDIFQEEVKRRQDLCAAVPAARHNAMAAQLVLASDQFVVLVNKRAKKNELVNTVREEMRTIIAGYHWFTDWGRDTMISLEGLTLCTGRHAEAKAILKTFAQYVRNGLLPNHFPEGNGNAIYNTVDATFWYFHAIDRYLHWTGDQSLLKELYPTLCDIINCHVKGTDFGIHMDLKDSLISAAAPGFQLTWMDAKVDEWVVTPRRGKPVEIQALWYNALKLMEQWSNELDLIDPRYTDLSWHVRRSFNERFCCPEKGYLFDVVDSFQGDDAALRPNQIFAISLRYPVLDQSWWKTVMDVMDERLLTPWGLRTLDPADKDYHPYYEGNRWNRDAAYHQGLIWTWLLGHYFDAHHRVYPESRGLDFFKPLFEHLCDAGAGTISEIFDAEPPHYPRGCIAQAWSVAEVLRILVRLTSRNQPQEMSSKILR